MHLLIRFLLLFCCLPFASLAQEEPQLGIAAIVNDEVISTIDVDDRMQFLIATTKMSDTPETRKRLMSQVIRQLVDETLQLQEATKLNFTVTDADVAEAVGLIEKSQNKPAGSMMAKLEEWGIPPDTFLRQIRSQVAWSKIIRSKIRPLVKVSDEEVEMGRVQSVGGGDRSEVKISLLSLSVDQPEQEKDVRDLGEKLVREIEGGAQFADVARNLAPGSLTEELWVPMASLDPSLARLLQTAEPGTISSPVRTPDGYTIVQLLDRRIAANTIHSDSELLLKDILLKLKPDASQAEAETLLTIGREVARYPGNCRDKTVSGIDDLEAVDIETSFVHTRLSELSETIRNVVASLSVGSVSEPFATEEGIRLFMLCERVDAPPDLNNKEETYTRLMNQKLELQARKYMRDLRREAYVEFR